MPIVFEVYQWLVYETHQGTAQFGLQRMRRSLAIVYPTPTDFDAVATVLGAMPTRKGTLEDALVGHLS